MWLSGTEKLLDHFLGAIKTAEFSSEPWPHLCVSNIFPIDAYNELLSHLPLDDQMQTMGPKSIQSRRLYWLIKDGHVVDGPNKFWNAVRDLLLVQLRLTLEVKFKVQCDYVGSEIIHDVPPYFIGPHTDSPNKLVTGLFYLPATAENATYGTELYSCDEPDQRGRGHKFSPEYKLGKLTPYVPNSALFFKRTNFSYHGVRPTKVERWLLAYDLFKG